MADISINNLDLIDSGSSLVSLKDTELGLLKSAVKRAIDSRQVVGGIISDKCPPTMGFISPLPIGRIIKPEPYC